MTPERDRALDLTAALLTAVINFGHASWEAGAASGTVDAYEPLKAAADAHRGDAERLAYELRDLVAPACPRRRGLPSFGEMRQGALRLIGDAQAELCSDWHEGTGPTRKQATAMRAAVTALARAAAALDHAAER